MGFFDKIQDNLDEMNINTIFTKNNRLKRYDTSDYGESELPYIKMVLPLSIGIKERASNNYKEKWLLPIEPLISVSGKNVIVKRNTVKNIIKSVTEYSENNISEMAFWGTIKERWAKDDIQISIEGRFESPYPDQYPERDVSTLMYYIDKKEALSVENKLLNLLGINYIVIESFSFPMTKGENVQNYTIEAVSDCLTNLYIKPKIEQTYV